MGNSSPRSTSHITFLMSWQCWCVFSNKKKYFINQTLSWIPIFFSIGPSAKTHLLLHPMPIVEKKGIVRMWVVMRSWGGLDHMDLGAHDHMWQRCKNYCATTGRRMRDRGTRGGSEIEVCGSKRKPHVLKSACKRIYIWSPMKSSHWELNLNSHSCAMWTTYPS